MNYAKLRGRIREICGTQEKFADAIALDPSSVSAKLNGKSEWTRQQIEDACHVLQIQLEEVSDYFFYRVS